MKAVCLAVLISAALVRSHLVEKYISVPLDHSAPWNNRSLSLRYLVDASYFTANGPLLVYTGNEGPIDGFATPEKAGLQYALAEELGGAAIFLEERYYGKSIPIALTTDLPYAFLSSVQVVSDYAVALGQLRRVFNSTRVLALGGSYGGMLAAYLRKRHPDLVTAALASSAPVLGYASTLIANQKDGDFYNVTETAYPCSAQLGAAFEALWAAPASAWQQVGADFGLCSQIETRQNIETLIGFLQKSFSDLAFVNYPYSSSSLPANPTDYACSRIKYHTGHTGTAGWLPLRDALAWHYQKIAKCLSLANGFAAYTPGFLEGPWTFQRCTDLVMAFSVQNTSRMFLSCEGGFRANCEPEGLQALRRFCASKFGVTVPDPVQQQDTWGSDWSNHGGGSKIIFSNGDLDPWSYGGVPDGIMSDDGPIVLHITGGAHHIDLRSDDPNDPPGVTACRVKERAILRKWLS